MIESPNMRQLWRSIYITIHALISRDRYTISIYMYIHIHYIYALGYSIT